MAAKRESRRRRGTNCGPCDHRCGGRIWAFRGPSADYYQECDHCGCLWSVASRELVRVGPRCPKWHEVDGEEFHRAVGHRCWCGVALTARELFDGRHGAHHTHDSEDAPLYCPPCAADSMGE